MKFENRVFKLKIQIFQHLPWYVDCSEQTFEIWGKSHRKEREDPGQLNLDNYL